MRKPKHIQFQPADCPPHPELLATLERVRDSAFIAAKSMEALAKQLQTNMTACLTPLARVAQELKEKDPFKN